MHHVGWDASDQYQYDVLTDPVFLEPRSQSGADLRAALASLHDQPTAFSVLRNGPVAASDVEAFFDVYRRGRQELRTWLEDQAGEHMRHWAADARYLRRSPGRRKRNRCGR